MKIEYKDMPFRVIASILAAHFIVMYGVETHFFQVLLKPIYWIAMAGSVTIAYLLIIVVRGISIRLDKKYDWEEKRLERVLLQFLVGFLIPGIIAFLLAFIYFSLRGKNIFDTLYLRIDYPIILVLLAALNAYYFTYYMAVKLKHAKEVTSVDSSVQQQAPADGSTFLVNRGAKNIPVPVDTIAYFFREGNFNLLRTFALQDYPITTSLDEVEELMGEHNFFRANRQMLVSKKACKHFETLPHNKLELFTEPNYKHQIVISQLRNRNFKDWIEGK